MICSQQLWNNSILDYEKDKSTVKNIYHKGWIDFNKNGVKDIYEDSYAPLEARVQNLLSQMTLEEKSCQMATLYGSGRVLNDALPSDNWKNEVWKDGIGNIDEEHNGLGSFKSAYSFPYAHHVKTKHAIQRWFVENTRLGIPVDFTNEGIRGLCHDRATYFPAQCGQGATWNKELIAQIGEAEAREASVLGYTNIYSPILDIAQDPRWGRCVETYGEDPYHAGQMGKQMILSLQKNKLVSTPKHFAVYSIPVGGRDGKTRTDPHVAPREMRTLYLDPFRVAFHEAGHSICGLVLSDSRTVRKVTIVPRGRAGGYNIMLPKDDQFILTKKQLFEQIVGLMGGRAGEEVVVGDQSTGASNDFEQATAIARSMVVNYGMTDELGMVELEKEGEGTPYGFKPYSEATAAKIDEAVKKILDEAHAKAVEIVENNREKHRIIAEALLKYETLDEKQIYSLYKTGKMPEKFSEEFPSEAKALSYEEAKEAAQKRAEEKAEEDTAEKQALATPSEDAVKPETDAAKLAEPDASASQEDPADSLPTPSESDLAKDPEKDDNDAPSQKTEQTDDSDKDE